MSVLIPGGFTVLPEEKPTYICDDPRTSFMEEMESHGYSGLSVIPTIGKIERVVAPGDKRGKKNGWYWYNEFTDDFKPGALIGFGVFGDWKLSSKITWSSKRRNSMSSIEQARLDEQIKTAKIAREVALIETRKAAATKAQAIWEAAIEAPAEHPYLKAKGIEPHGVRVSRGSIVIPVTRNGTIMSLQFVGVDGGKKFLSGGEVKGCSYVIGAPTDTVYVVEGFATGATIHEATGDRVYVAFNAGNLMESTSAAKDENPDTYIVIAADDDHKTDDNPGRDKADAASNMLRCKVIYPNVEGDDTDFNDMARREGIEAVKALLATKPKVYDAAALLNILPDELLSPVGVLGDIVAYYNQTARVQQPGFSVQTSLAIVSVILARSYATNKNNWSSLYLLNIADSGRGKEHARDVIDKILEAADLGHLIAGGGYTSQGAVVSTLLRKPKHITVIDEFGRYLEASNSKNSNQMQHEANTKLMEVIGQCGGIVRPPSYSTMTLTKEKADDITNRICVHPGLTLMCMTTPKVFFRNISLRSIEDGFLGRFIVQYSDIIRKEKSDPTPIEVPTNILNWIKAVITRCGEDIGIPGLPADAPEPIIIPISQAAKSVVAEFDRYIIKLANKLDVLGLAEICGRSAEMAAKVSLIVALSENPAAGNISEAHMTWSVAYVKHALDAIVFAIKDEISGSPFDAAKKAVLRALREQGQRGTTWSEMQKQPPFSHHRPKDLTEILDALTLAELIMFDRVNTGGRGRPRQAYIATG